MTTSAPETGEKQQPGTHMARARKRTEARPAPESPRLPASFLAEALKANPGWKYLAEQPVPSYSLAPIVGQAGFAKWDAAFTQCGKDADAARREHWEDEPAGNERVYGPLDAWRRCELYVPPVPAAELAPLPADSAAAGGEDLPAAAGSISGPGAEPPAASGPDPAPAEALEADQ